MNDELFCYQDSIVSVHKTENKKDSIKEYNIDRDEFIKEINLEVISTDTTTNIIQLPGGHYLVIQDSEESKLFKISHDFKKINNVTGKMFKIAGIFNDKIVHYSSIEYTEIINGYNTIMTMLCIY